MRFERFPIVVVLLLTLSLATVPMFGQSLTTGNITGTVLDPSRAVIAGATVELKGLDTVRPRRRRPRIPMVDIVLAAEARDTISSP